MNEVPPKTRADLAANHPKSSQAPRQDGGQDAELSLGQVMEFVLAHYRKLALAACLGGLVGFSGWAFLGSYRAELTLTNSAGGLDLVSWRTIALSLPALADQITQEDKAPKASVALYRQMGEASWWQKNAQPTYALTKADMKELAAVGKELDGAATSILSITMTAAGQSRQAAMDNVQQASHFLLSGGAYLQLRNTLNGYEGEALATRADIERQISAEQIELAYLQGRAANLEDLLKRFPADQKVASQVIDPKDSGAKYLPIGTQIIAINTELYQRRESLQRLANRLAQIQVINRFIEQAIPLSRAQFDGLLLAKELLRIEQDLRKTVAAGDLMAQLPLDVLRARLLAIQNRFTNGVEASAAPSAKKRGMIKATAGGGALATALMLVWLLGRAALGRLRPEQAEPA